MELYIEKEFLDNFFIEYDEEKLSREQQVVSSILKEYGEIDWFIDTEINDAETLEKLKLSNPFIAYRASYAPPIPVKSLQDHFFKNSRCRQTLIFTDKEEAWHKEAEAEGALCFSSGNFQNKIEDIIEKAHFKIDLSEDFKNWDVFKALNQIPFNEILVNDNYILTDKPSQALEKNIIPLLQIILNGKNLTIGVKIFTRELNGISDSENHVFEAVKKRYKKLNRELANYKKKIRIINNSLKTDTYDLHDRVLLTNFLSIDSGKGFNLFPNKKSNSQIIIESIFDKYTYKRIKNHQRMYDEYLQRLENMNSVKFKIYPS
ncbi:hypothetical protein [Salegentibacter sp. Hel_I_6]|uniref:hypothetical protein n=1 Tax=Salegentibacter sp. Hel_I_6 TaxID=1250278 RepID=UPI00055B0505|nr:hypothetical protein [Salegentibacter sp. Hel_I_6]